MKNLFKLFLVSGILVFAASCEKADDKLTYNGEPYLHFTQDGYGFIVTPSDTGYDLVVGTTTSAGTTVELAIDTASTAIEGVHFEVFNKSVAIADGEFVGSVKIVPILANLDAEYTLILNITNSTVPEDVKLNQSFTLTLSRFCPTAVAEWIGPTFNCNEPGYGDYDVNFSAGTEPNTLVSDNFWDFGGATIYTLTDASGPSEAIVTIEEQIVVMGGTDYQVSGSGTYEQCSKTMVVNYEVRRLSDGVLLDQNTHTFTLK